nr:hypothetical protein [Tanacetum cinerariifolium]
MPQLHVSSNRIEKYRGQHKKMENKIRSIPRSHRTPTLTTNPQRKKRKQTAGESSSLRKSHKLTIKWKKPKEEIEKLVEVDEDEESYASEFVDSVLNDDVDDSGTRLEPESHKENPEKEKDIVDDVTGSMEIRNEQKQTPITSPTRSPRNVSSSDKIVFEELTATVSPTTATTSKDSSTTKHKKRFISYKTKTLPGSIAGMCRRLETPENPLPVNIETIEVFMNRVGYQGVVDKKFLDIHQRIEEDYHTIKDDIPLEMIERDQVAEATILSLILYKTALVAEAQEDTAKVQEKLDEEEIEKMVEGDEDEESYASEFPDLVLNDDEFLHQISNYELDESRILDGFLLLIHIVHEIPP